VILTMQRGADSVTSEMVFANPAFAMTPAAQTKAFVAMDGLYLLGFGPRTAAAAHDLAGRLYPDLSSEKDHWTSRVLATDCRS
jgi:iron complex transport system substrate-binding protein